MGCVDVGAHTSVFFTVLSLWDSPRWSWAQKGDTDLLSKVRAITDLCVHRLRTKYQLKWSMAGGHGIYIRSKQYPSLLPNDVETTALGP